MAGSDSLRPNNQAIREGFESILDAVKDAWASVNIIASGFSTSTAKLDAWSQRVVGLDFGNLLSSVQLNENSPADLHIATAITVAGIGELILESRFPDFLARESPMLDQYREQLFLKR